MTRLRDPLSIDGSLAGEAYSPDPIPFIWWRHWTSRSPDVLSLHVEPRPRRSHVATFGMAVAAHGHQGCGVASALMRTMIDMCDNWLRVERIELTVFADNAPAVAVYKKYGFEIEGTAKGYALRNGEYVDAYYMARIK